MNMKWDLIRKTIIGFFFLVTMSVYVYSMFLVPNHSVGQGEYGLNSFFVYIPVLFLISGFFIGAFLERNEWKRYIAILFSVLLGLSVFFRFIITLVAISEVLFTLFAVGVYTLFLTILHGVSLIISRCVLRVFKH